MQRLIRHQLLIVAAASIVFFVNLGATGLWDLDEALYTSIAREMNARGDWVVPTFNDQPFYDKPPLMFWLMMGSFKVLGVSELSARLASAMFGIGTALATYHLARRLFSADVALWAGLAATSNIIFTVSARAATVDSALTFLTTVVMWLFAVGANLGNTAPIADDGSLNSRRTAYLPKAWSTFALIGMFLGFAILAKGPVGFLLPAASLGLFLVVMNQCSRNSPSAVGKNRDDSDCNAIARQQLADGTRRASAALWTTIQHIVAPLAPGNLMRTTWAMRPLTVLGFAALVALPWFVMIAIKTDGEWLRQFVTKYNVGPFIKPFLGHHGPLYYHFVVVLVGFFPWSVFLGPTCSHVYRAIRTQSKELPSYVFLICWAAVFFGFWSMCSTKLPHYVLPAYPALSILTARFLDAWIERPEAAARRVMPIATGITVFVGVAMLVVLPYVAARYVPGEQIIAAIGIALVLGGGLCSYFLRNGRRLSYTNTFAATSVVFVGSMFGLALCRIDRHQHSRPLMDEVRRDSRAEPQIAGYKYCDASTVYYAGKAVETCDDATKLREFLNRSPHPYVVTTGMEEINLKTLLPGEWRVVARRPRFLAKGEIVVLTPNSSATASSGHTKTNF